MSPPALAGGRRESAASALVAGLFAVASPTVAAGGGHGSADSCCGSRRRLDNKRPVAAAALVRGVFAADESEAGGKGRLRRKCRGSAPPPRTGERWKAPVAEIEAGVVVFSGATAVTSDSGGGADGRCRRRRPHKKIRSRVAAALRVDVDATASGSTSGGSGGGAGGGRCRCRRSYCGEKWRWPRRWRMASSAPPAREQVASRDVPITATSCKLLRHTCVALEGSWERHAVIYDCKHVCGPRERDPGVLQAYRTLVAVLRAQRPGSTLLFGPQAHARPFKAVPGRGQSTFSLRYRYWWWWWCGPCQEAARLCARVQSVVQMPRCATR